MPSILITGSNRGLGLEWARQFAMDDWRVYASCRHPAEAGELQKLARQYPKLSLHRLDVTRQDEIQALALELANYSIDILLNNAGVYLEKYETTAAAGLCYDDWKYTLAFNTLGPMRVSEAFTPHLARGRQRLILAITSHMGSIAEISSPGSYYYRSSKAALNAAVKSLAIDLAPRGIVAAVLHPGWVKTDMGGPNALIGAEQSVSGMRRVIAGLTPAKSGAFLAYDGSAVPW